MKKQINPTIKAQILRSAFILLSLVAICAIPFSLAQRNTTKRSVAKPAAKPNLALVPTATGMQGASPAGRPVSPQLPYDVRSAPTLPRMSDVPQTTSGVAAAHILPIPRAPKAPQVVLYDQYNNNGPNATLSATFTDFPTFSSDLADDFVVPGGETWNVQSIDADGVYFNGPGPATDWNVFIYTDSSTLPGTLVFSATNQPVVHVGTTFTVNLPVAAVLAAGTYWIEIQANMTFGTQGEWGWTDRTVQANNGAAFRNPGGAFGCGTAWVRKPVCVPTTSGPDQVWRINGTIGGGATPTATPTCSPGEVIVNGGFETGDFTGWVTSGANTPVVSTNQAHSGTFSGFAGDSANGFCGFPGVETAGDSVFYQQVTVAAGGGTLSFWYWTCTTDSITFDWQDAYITDTSGTILQTIFHQCTDNQAWVQQTLDMTPYAGQTVRIEFLVHLDNFGDLTGMYVDDVSLPAGACGSPTPTASPTCTPGGSFQVLIVNSDVGVQPVMLHNQIAAEPGVTAVDYFDAEFATPTLAQLQPYNIVVSFSNSTYADPVAMGDVLADYADAGGIVVAFNFDWFGPPFGLEGRWQTGGYSPFVEGGPINFNTSCLGSFNAGHPLMAGIPAGSLCAFFRHNLALSAGAVSVAEYQDNEHLCAYQVFNGHTGVGINAYVGDFAGQWSGPFGTVVVNAGRWLLGGGGCGSPTPTPTSTPGGCQVTGSIDTGDPTQTDRLFRSGIPQTCPSSNTCAIFGDPTPHHYDLYTFTNTTGVTQCVNIDTNTACTGTNFIFTAAYLGSFDPNNICTNWIGDSGFSPNPDQAFQVSVDNGQTIVIVVSEVTPNAGCPAYTVTVTGICGGGTPTATPTATFTPTATPTSTATIPPPTPTATATATIPPPTPTATATVTVPPRPSPTPRPRPTPPPRP